MDKEPVMGSPLSESGMYAGPNSSPWNQHIAVHPIISTTDAQSTQADVAQW